MENESIRLRCCDKDFQGKVKKERIGDYLLFAIKKNFKKIYKNASLFLELCVFIYEGGKQ